MPVRPLRRRAPFISVVPGVAPPPVPRVPRSALLVALAISATPRLQPRFVPPPPKQALVQAAGTNWVKDSFTDTAGVLLEAHTPETGGPWVHWLGVNPNPVIDSANQLMATSATGGGTIDYATATPPNGSGDYDLSCDWHMAGAGTTANGLIARQDVTQSNLQGYTLTYDKNQNFWILTRYIGGAPVILGSWAESLSVGNVRTAVWQLRGPLHSVWINGTLRIQVSDGTYLSPGHVGLWLNGADSNTTGIHLDNFNAVSTGAPLPYTRRVIPAPRREPLRGVVFRTTLPRAGAAASAASRPLSPLIARRDRRLVPGSVWLNKVPDRTVRLDAAQTTALVARRDERRYAGAALIGSPSKTGVAVIIPRTPRHLLARRDERAFAGRVVIVKVPDRTLRLTPLLEASLIARRDERRYAGEVWLNKVPDRTVRLAAFQEAPLAVRRDTRGFSGSACFFGPHRRTDPKPGKAAFLAGRDERRYPGAVFTVRVPSRTVRLSPFQADVAVARRDERVGLGRVIVQPLSRMGAAAVAGSLRTVRVLGGRGRLILPVVPGAGTAVVVTPGKAPRALVVRRDERRQVWGGAALIGHPPARTVRLDAFQVAVIVNKRDERRFAGSVLLGRPTRTGTAIIVPRLPLPLTARRDRRGFPGSVFLAHVPARTVRLDAFQEAARIVRRDQRGFPGAVVLTRVPGRTVRLTAPQECILVARRDERRGAGSVWISTPHRPVVAVGAPRAALTVVQARGYSRVIPVLFTAPKRLTLRLAPGLLQSRLFTRQSFPNQGAALFIRPNRPRVIPRLPFSLVVRRDERGFRGRSLASPSGRQNAVAVLHGNPRAKVLLRAGPGATMVLRAAPTATVTLRPQPTAALTFNEG